MLYNTCLNDGWQSATYPSNALLFLGAVTWRQHCARLLQCAYRGYKARRAYRVLLRSHYVAGFGDPQRRREFLSDEAADKAGRLVMALEHRQDSIDRRVSRFSRFGFRLR